MFRYISAVLVVSAFILGLNACSGGGNPTAPSPAGPQSNALCESQASSHDSGRVLWGVWHVTLDPLTETAEIEPLRSAAVGVNVTRFMHPPVSPTHMISFEFIPGESDYDNGLFVLDVGLKHPFPGYPMYRGFDVRGIFYSGADASLPGDSYLAYASETASHMLNPDGYTRWWNSTEFPVPGLFGFTPGKLAPPVYPDAILSPYKYFCDDLEQPDSPLSEVTLESRGTFGTIPGFNKRRYEVQFKMDLGKPVFDFNYAVDASWEDLGPDAISWEVDDFPLSANCNEAWWGEIDTSESSMFYVDPGNKGGELVTDVTVHDWQSLAPGGSVAAEVSGINLHSILLSTNVMEMFSSGAVLLSEGPGVATWRLTTVSDDLDITGQGEYGIWAEVLSADPNTYEPQFPGGDVFPHADGPLAAYMRGSSTVGDIVPQDAPTVTEVIPDWGYQDTNLDDVRIIGTNFIEQGLEVEFDNGSYAIPVSGVTLISDTEITVDLDLNGAEIDLYDVTVRVDNLLGPGTLEGTLEDGFEVLAPIDEYGWPFLGRNALRNCLAEVNGPQTANQVYSAACTKATAAETLVIGMDPDEPGEWLVYIGYYSSSGTSFAAYRASDGSVKWSVNPPSPYSFYRVMAVAPPGVPCPNNEQGTVYVWAYPPGLAAPDKVVALSAVDGSTLWEYTASAYSWLQLERFGLVNDDGDFIFCHAAGGYWLRCLDHTDGSTKWAVSTGFHQTPDPALSPDGNTAYINAGSSTTLRAYDLTSTPPTQKWSLYLGSYYPAEMQSQPIVASDGAIYEMGRNNRLVKIIDNGTYASVTWATSIGGYQSAWIQLAEGPDGSIYSLIPSSLYSSSLYRFDPSDGSVLNQSATFGVRFYTGMAIGADGKVYIGGWNSGVYCFDADCSTVWSDPVSGCFFTDAALLDDGSLFVADIINGYLYRYQ